MKNLKITLAVALILLMSAFCAVACSGGAEGTYKLYTIQSGDNTFGIGDTFEEVSSDELTADFYVLELKSDGTATVSSKLGNSSEPASGVWKEDDDNKIILTVGEENTTFLKGDNSLTFTIGDKTVTLKK